MDTWFPQVNDTIGLFVMRHKSGPTVAWTSVGIVVETKVVTLFLGLFLLVVLVDCVCVLFVGKIEEIRD